MTSTFWKPFAVRASLAFAAASVGILAVAPGAHAQTPAGNKTIVQRSFDAWTAGTGSPFDLLADEASWTIERNSVVSKTYPTKEAFMREVIRPFNARMSAGIKPTIKSITADGDRVVIHFDAAGTARDGKPYVNTYAWFFQMRGGRVTRAFAFFDAIAFNDLWARVAPAE
ncbi:nuclear transport factor 2 family protein [Sphingomonas albertensis]|uniref:Nuclear transport factor 2 family protein n=1 Tax=Sphingomonas albertensis TaxID=2762591 RepID=A0ABR7AHY3_9SPHN|nr:nuclear transport factor 2 family protein [Sphingomonas albertensis]MBC3940069.1 nuclear transport factor 2 family protein [Sphingomonas albertensis]